MGMFDTVHFPQPVTCVECGAQITETQTKAFECLMDNFHVGDCVTHAEELRIVREGLYCEECRAMDKQFVYLVVYRGILADIALDLATAEAQLRSFSFEKLIFWYHDQYGKRMAQARHQHRIERFLDELVEWYTEGYDKSPLKEKDIKRWLILHHDTLEQAADPIDAVRTFLAQNKEDVQSADAETD